MSKGSVLIAVLGNLKTFRELIDAISATMIKKGYTDIKVFNQRWKDIVSTKTKVPWEDINIVIVPSGHIQPIMYPKKDSVKILIMTEQQPIIEVYGQKWDRKLVFFPKISVDGAVRFPLGYSTQFDNIEKHDQTENADTYFFGALTPHRRSVLRKNNIQFEQQVWGKERDILINKARLNVNILAFAKPYFFAPIHALLVLCKGKFLLQESCQGDYDIYKPYIKEFILKDFQSQKRYWLANEDERLQFSMDARERLKNTLDFDEEFEKATKGLI